jgi:hypothetical protein
MQKVMRILIALTCTVILAGSAATQPDLNGGALLFPEPDRVDPGDSFFLPFAVSNGGTGASPPFEVAIYFSTDRFVSDDDSLLVRLPFEALGAQQNAFSNATLTVPDVPRGGYRVLVSMDDPDEVAETNETNNVSYGLLTVGGDFGGPDLLIGTGSLEDG